MFVLCCIWFVVAIPWIVITSTLDKEWMIDEGGVKNICHVLEYLENDDTRDVGVIMTLPLFFPFFWFALWRKNAVGLCMPPHWLFSATGCGSFFCAISFACEPDGFIRPQRPYKLPV